MFALNMISSKINCDNYVFTDFSTIISAGVNTLKYIHSPLYHKRSTHHECFAWAHAIRMGTYCWVILTVTVQNDTVLNK